MKPQHILILILVLALGFRLILALTHDNYLGVDGGAYQLSVNTVLGDEPTGAGFPRPPLAPGWLLVPFVKLWGTDTGYKVWSAIASVFPIIPVYLVSRLFLRPWGALIPTALISLDLWQAEMFVTGALPLVGFSLIMVCVWCVAMLMRGKGYRYITILILAFGVTPWINQTSAALILIAVPVYFFASAAFHPSVAEDRRGALYRVVAAPLAYSRVTVAILVGGIVALGALPWYLNVLPGSKILHYPGPWVYLASIADMAWVQLLITVPIGLIAILKGTRWELRALGVLVVLHGGLCVFLSTDETVINVFYRSRYLVMLLFWPCLVWVLAGFVEKMNLRSMWVPASVAAIVLLVFGFGYYHTFHRQAYYSDMVTIETAKALDIARVNNSEGAIITNSFTLSLWVSALNKVQTPHVWTWEPPRAYTKTDEQVRCILGWVDGCDVGLSVQDLSARYVLVDERWPYYNDRAPGNYMAPPDQWKVTEQAPWLELVYSEGTTRLWRIDPQS